MNNDKKKLGQFFTKNSKYIIGSFVEKIKPGATIIDPFCGEWDLLNLFDDSFNKVGYDISPKNKETIKLDTLKNKLDLNNKTVITNPPYLARNKNKEKEIYETFKTDDLYKIAIKNIIGCKDGILIIPINFFSSNDKEIRNEFLSKYIVSEINVFEEKVFEDTSYTVCSFYFYKKENNNQTILFNIFPNKKSLKIELKKENSYTIGAEIYSLQEAQIDVSRLLVGEKPNSNIFISCIDTRKEYIKFSVKNEHYYGINTDRVFATIKFNKTFSIEQQKKIVEKSNQILNYFRDKYGSLFLTNYRDYGRKRLGFDLAYKIIKHSIFLLGNTGEI